MGMETRPKVGWQNVRPAKGNVAHGIVARGLGLLCPNPIGVRITCCRITELKFGNCAESVEVIHGDGRCVSWQRKPQKRAPTGSAGSRSDEIGTVGANEAAGAGVIATGSVGRGRGARGGVIAPPADGLGAPPGPTP